MKKARAWLDAHDVAYAFHDYKAAGIERGKLEGWAQEGRLGDAAQSRRHDLSQAAGCRDKEGLTEKKAIALMLAQPSMIKRPVLDQGGKLTVGFKPEVYDRVFAKR